MGTGRDHGHLRQFWLRRVRTWVQWVGGRVIRRVFRGSDVDCRRSRDRPGHAECLALGEHSECLHLGRQRSELWVCAGPRILPAGYELEHRAHSISGDVTINHGGYLPSALISSTDNPFQTADPLVAATGAHTQFFADAGPGNEGTSVDVDLGILNPYGTSAIPTSSTCTTVSRRTKRQPIAASLPWRPGLVAR